MMDKIVSVPLELIGPNPYQPASRVKVDDATAARFAASILEHGLLQTPVGRKVGDRYQMGDGWLRLAGYRRLAAEHPQEDKWKIIPVRLKSLTDRQMADLVLEANTVRQDLNPLELASFYQKYLTDFGLTQTELGQKHNLSQSEIANTLRLLDLPEPVQHLIIAREISATHGRCLLQVKDWTVQVRLAREAAERSLSVAALDAEVKAALAHLQPRLEAAQSPPAAGTQGSTAGTTGERLTAGSPPGTGAMPAVPPVPGPETRAAAPAGEKRQREVTKPVQPPAVSPAKGTPAVEPPKPGQAGVLPSRKVTLTETADGVLAAVVATAHPFPFMQKLQGTMEAAGVLLPQFLADAEVWWQPKEAR